MVGKILLERLNILQLTVRKSYQI